MALLFLLALLLAWPTFGISVLAWIALAIFRAQSGNGTIKDAASGVQRGSGFLEKGALEVSFDLIAKKAASPEAFSGGIGTAFSNREAVEGYFRKFGSTERKFDFHPNPPFYMGYVKVPIRAEFLSVVMMQDGGSVVASFEPDMRHGQDFLGLVGKKMFADEVASQFVKDVRRGNGSGIADTERKSSLAMREEGPQQSFAQSEKTYHPGQAPSSWVPSKDSTSAAQKRRIVRSVVDWGLRFGLSQFRGYAHSLSDDEVDEVFSLKKLSAARGYGSEEAITFIPDEVFLLPKLECLTLGKAGYPELYNVELATIPRAIGNSTSLKYLHLQYCGLNDLPSHTFTPVLKELKLGGNDIKIIPDGISRARSLTMLTAWMNDLEYISEEIGVLTNLKRVDLSGNPRLRLPHSIVNLGDMKELLIDEDLSGLTSEQTDWIQKNNYTLADDDAGPEREDGLLF